MSKSFFRFQNLDFITAFLCMVMTVAFHAPGYALYDTLMQVKTARAIFTSETVWDIHPIVMSLMIKFFDLFGIPLLGMLAFHQFLFWAGILLILRSLLAKRAIVRNFILVSFFVYPVFQGLSGAILKDIGMAHALVFTTGLLAYAFENRNRKLLKWSLAPLFYAFAVRSNAAPAILPFLFLIALGLNSINLRSTISEVKGVLRKSLILSSKLFVAFIVGNLFITKNIVRARHYHHIQQLQLFDLVGISVRTNLHLIPEDNMIQPPLSMEQIRSRYNSDSCMYMFALGEPEFLLKENFVEGPLEKLKALWIKNIFAHPKEYLAHRSELFQKTIGTYPQEPCWPLFNATDPNDLHFTAPSGEFHKRVFKFLDGLKTTFIFVPYFYFLFGIIIMVAGVFSRRWPSMLLLSSAILYEMTFFLVGVACDFRYSYWPILAMLLSAIFHFGSLFDATDIKSGHSHGKV